MSETFKTLYIVSSETVHELVSMTMTLLCHRTSEVILLVPSHLTHLLAILLAFASLCFALCGYEINFLGLHI